MRCLRVCFQLQAPIVLVLNETSCVCDSFVLQLSPPGDLPDHCHPSLHVRQPGYSPRRIFQSGYPEEISCANLGEDVKHIYISSVWSLNVISLLHHKTMHDCV